MLLLNDKLTHKFLANPAFMHREFVYNYQEYPRFQRDLADALAFAWLDRNVAELEEFPVAGVADFDRQRVSALAEWFRVERRFLHCLELLYQGEDLYLIDPRRMGGGGACLRAGLRRSARGVRLLGPDRHRAGGVAVLGRRPLLPLLRREGAWLEGDVFGVFLRWLAARSADPRGPDVIGSYESGPRHFLAGLRRFRWPMD